MFGFFLLQQLTTASVTCMEEAEAAHYLKCMFYQLEVNTEMQRERRVAIPGHMKNNQNCTLKAQFQKRHSLAFCRGGKNVSV